MCVWWKRYTLRKGANKYSEKKRNKNQEHLKKLFEWKRTTKHTRNNKEKNRRKKKYQYNLNEYLNERSRCLNDQHTYTMFHLLYEAYILCIYIYKYTKYNIPTQTKTYINSHLYISSSNIYRQRLQTQSHIGKMMQMQN